MARKRSTDPKGAKTRYRTDRLQEDGGKWYFSTREGTLEGPFSSRNRAEEALHAYLAIVKLGLVEAESELSMTD